MAFNANLVTNQLRDVEKTLRNLDKNIKQTLRRRDKEERDYNRYLNKSEKRQNRTQGVLDSAKEAASRNKAANRGTRKKRHATSRPMRPSYITSQKIARDIIGAKERLNEAHTDLVDASNKIGTLKKLAKTLHHSNQINALSKRTTRSLRRINDLITRLDEPLGIIQHENQSYIPDGIDITGPKIIKDYGMISPNQLEGDELKREFKRMFPDVSESDLEEELAAYPTPDITPSPSYDAVMKEEAIKTQELAAKQDRIAKALARPIGLTAKDEEELRQELERLEQEFEGGKRKKRKTRKRKRQRKRKTRKRKRKKKRRKHKTRRR